MKKTNFKPPTDVKQWWMAPCCGPGSTDPDKYECECGKSGRECARHTSDVVARVLQLDPDQEGGETAVGDPDGEKVCGWCGFWCADCGRFWAGDTCGGSGIPDMNSADDTAMEVRGSDVYCVCGRKVATGYEEER